MGPHQEELNKTPRKNQRVRVTRAKEDYGQEDERDPQDQSHLLLFKASSSAPLGWRPWDMFPYPNMFTWNLLT